MYSINSYFSINEQIRTINRKRLKQNVTKKDPKWIEIKQKQQKLNKLWNSGNSKLCTFLLDYYNLQDDCQLYMETHEIQIN
tara:strand:+ start:602 stop:844 length:243 start_codon:yes stop_codon:yes gene_type:complete